MAQAIPLEIPMHHVSTFNNIDSDDAFDLSEDHLTNYDLAEAVRRDVILPNPSALGTDPSGDISTLNTNGIAPSPQEGMSPSLDSSTLSSEFSQISLSNDDHNAADSVDLEDHGQTDSPYPAVVIDASESSTPRVTVSLGKNFTSSSKSPPPGSPSAESTRSLPPETMNHNASESETPQISASASSPTIPALSVATNTHQFSQSSENIQSPGKKPSSHRPSRSAGQSIFEKVRSKTRPIYLPPKPKAEDEKHLADWNKMMKLSRATAEKRRRALQERRLAREQHIEASLHIWEREIVPDWRVVFKNPQLRKLWWQGVPTKLRASMWEKAVGNPLALSKDHYRSCISRAKRAISTNIFPQATLDLIEEDIRSTLPSMHLFHPEFGPMYADLKDMLYAWVVARSDEGLGYTYGAAKIAGMMLIVLPIQQAFNVLRNFLERHCLRSFYGGERSKDDVEAYYRIFDTLLADGMPKIYFNFKQHQLSPVVYLPDWLVTLFIDHLPFEACARIWDVIMLEGDAFLYRAALGILAVLEPRLFFPERKELLELLRGENKAAIDVAKREGTNMNGGKYEIYGVDEETLWERIDAMDDWWKENTWTRLIRRELPDV